LLFYYFRILDSENALINGNLHDTRFASLLVIIITILWLHKHSGLK